MRRSVVPNRGFIKISVRSQSEWNFLFISYT